MDRKLKLSLALFLAFAVLMQYSFSPQALFAYGLNNSDKAVQEEVVDDDAPAAEETKASDAEKPADAEQQDADNQQSETDAQKDSDEQQDADNPKAEDAQKNADENADTDADAAVKDAEKDAEEEETYPAVKFSKTAGDVQVSISAPEGALPEGATVKVVSVKASKVQDAVEELIDDAKVVKAVDITFYDKDGKEIEPKKDVSVTFASQEFSDLNDAAVVHINDDGDAEKVAGTKVDTDNNKATFKSDEFSIYAVIEDGSSDNARATLIFRNGTDVKATLYVKNSDSAEQLETIIYDPGVGTLSEGEVFKGWFISDDPNASYNVETEPLTIQGVRDYFEDLLITEGDVYYVNAMIFNAYTVQYQDIRGVVLQTETALSLGDEAADFEINETYVPEDPDTQQFQGWYVSGNATKEDGSPIGDNEALAVGTTIKVSGPVTLTPKAPSGQWLIFKENGKGASYTASQFIESDEVTEEPSQPTRFGYEFGGWYTDEECSEGNEFTFGSGINTKTVVYAKWTTKNPAEYTVIVWLENLAGNGYDFADSKTLEGDPTIEDLKASDAVQVHGEAGAANAYVVVDGTTYNGASDDKFKGFHYVRMEATNEDKILPEGTTVVNVFYARTEYTLKFYYARSSEGTGYNYTEVAHTNNLGTPTWNPGYGYESGETYYRNENGDRAYYWNGAFYRNQNHNNALGNSPIYIRKSETVNNYQVSQNYQAWSPTRWGGSGTTEPGCTFGTKGTEERGGYTYYYSTITAKYGADIGDIWPKYEEFATWNNLRLGSWAVMQESQAYQTTGQGTIKGKITIMDEQILGDLTSTDGNYLYANYDTASSQYEWIYHIYFQNESGTGYTLVEDVPARSHDPGTNWQTQQHPPAYSGMTMVSKERVGNNLEINYYYDRDIKTITFMDGAYVKGDGGSAVEGKSPAGELHQVGGILYDADVSSYNEGGDDYYIPTKDNIDNPNESPFDPTGFVFAGWYIDSGCTTAFEFSKMPEGGITVYAKWVEKQYRVFLNPKVPKSDTSFEWEGQSTSFRADYGEYLTITTPQRTNYELIGWYYDEGCHHVFSTEAYPMNDKTPGLAAYDQTDDTERDKYGETEQGKEGINTDAQNDRFWIDQKLTLYAKWRETISGANGIKVQYDSNGGSTAPQDPAFYKDQTNAIAKEATTPPTGSNNQFLYWVVQKWDPDVEDDNGDKVGGFVDTDEFVFPGDTFTVRKSYAHEEPAEGSTPDDPQLTYTMQLRAEYGPTKAPTPTHIYWYGNGGTADSGTVEGHIDIVEYPDGIQINQSFDILPAGTFTRPGYTFIGWAKITEPTKQDGSVDFDGFTQDDGLSPWLNYADNAFTIEGSGGSSTTVTKLAADEVTPYEAMVAVWKKPLTITVKDATKAYNGTEQSGYNGNISVTEDADTQEYKVEGLINGDELTVSGYTPSKGTEVNTYDNGSFSNATIKIMRGNNDVTRLYDITKIAGKLTITKQSMEVTIKGHTDTVTYDGSSHTVTGYDVTIPEGADFTESDIQTTGAAADPTIEETNVTTDNDGKYMMGLKAEQFSVSSQSYTVTFKIESDGWLKIDPAELTIEMADRTLPYNGQTQYGWTRDDEGKETVTGLVNGQTVTIDYTPSSGDVVGTYTNGEYDTDSLVIKDGNTVVTENYNLTTVTAGKLTIQKDEKELSVASASKDWDYDTDTHTYQVYIVTYGDETITGTEGQTEFTLSTGDKVTVTPTGKGANGVRNVSDSGANSFTWTVENEDSYTKGTDTVGTLTINPVSLTIIMADRTLPYSGQTQYGWTRDDDGKENVTGLVHNETVTIDYTPSSGKAVGTHTNGEYDTDSLVIKDGNTVVTENYNLTTVTAGKLTIQKDEKTLSVASGTMAWDYDADTHTYQVYTVTYGEETITGTEGQTEFTLSTGDKVTVTPTGKGANGVRNVSDSGDNSFTWTVENEGSYTKGTDTVGTLTINKVNLTITMADRPLPYNGETQYGWTRDDEGKETVTGLVNGQTVTIDYTPSSGDVVGTYTNGEYDTDSLVIKDGNTVVTENYNLTTVTAGKLTIQKDEKELSVASSSKIWVYDADTHTYQVYTVTYGDETITGAEGQTEFTLPTGDKVTVTPTGKGANGVKNVSDSGDNSFAWTVENEGSYTKGTDTVGKLMIKPLAVKVTIKGNTRTETYTSTAYEVSGYEATADSDMYKTGGVDADFKLKPGESAQAFRTNAGKTPMGLDNDSFENTNENFDVTFAVTDGYMEVTPLAIKVTIVGNHGTAEYDGSTHRVKGYKATADNTLFKVDKDMDFSGDATASRKTVGTTMMGLNKGQFASNNSNFIVTFVVTDGYLTITEGPDPGPDPGPEPGPGPNPNPNPNPTPNGGGGNNPGNGGGNPNGAVANNTPAPAPAAINDPAPPTTINDPPAPKAVPAYWALINLICAIITALLSLIMLIRYFGKRREEDEETGEVTEIKRKGGVRLASLIPAIGGIIAFILTEDMSNPMTLVDKWTLLMIIILAVQIVVAILAKTRKDEEDEGEEESTATA